MKIIEGNALQKYGILFFNALLAIWSFRRSANISIGLVTEN